MKDKNLEDLVVKLYYSKAFMAEKDVYQVYMKPFKDIEAALFLSHH